MEQSQSTSDDHFTSKSDTFRSYQRRWDLSSSHTNTTVSRHSAITSGPWSISPSGKHVCSQAMKLWREEDIFISSGSRIASDATCIGFEGSVNEYRKLYPQTCPFSPDGSMIACVFENRTGLKLALIQPETLDVLQVVKAKSECKGIKGTIASLVFSTDNFFLAVISSHGQVYILTTSGMKLRFVLEREKIIHPLETLDPSINEPSALEFDPRFGNKMFATCTFYRGLVKIWTVTKNDKFKRCAVETLYSIHFPRVVNVIKYSPEGDILAVGCNEGIITCLSSDDGSALFDLNTSIQPTEFRSKAGIYHLAFSRTSEQLAASYSDGYIRVWHIPVDINLQHLCRVVINESTPESKIMSLPLPSRLKRFLLYKPY